MTRPFPLKVILEPAETFRHISSTGWGWPLLLASLSAAASSFLFTALPPRFMAASFEGLTLSPEKGFLFYFPCAVSGALLLTAFICALASAFCRFLSAGRLSLRLPAVTLPVAAFGILAAAMHGSAGAARTFGSVAAAAAAAAALWAAVSDASRFRNLYKSVLSVSVITLSGSAVAGLAALADSAGGYALAENTFALAALFWLAKAATAVYGIPLARSAAAVVLSILCGLAFAFLLFNIGAIPLEIFKALMLA